MIPVAMSWRVFAESMDTGKAGKVQPRNWAKHHVRPVRTSGMQKSGAELMMTSPSTGYLRSRVGDRTAVF